MKKNICIFIFFVALSAGGIFAEPDKDEKIPDARAVQAAVWKQMEMQDFKLEGIMRTAEKLHPIILRTKNREMVYEFKDRPLQVRVELTSQGSVVQRRKKIGEPWKELGKKERLESILDSDIAYEDLGVDFLRWKNVKSLGKDSIKTLDAWAYEARPSGLSRYAKVQYWISSEYLAMLRVDAFNSKGQVIKRVEVNGVQQVPNTEYYVIKELMIGTIIPGRDLSKTRTYIEINSAKPGSGLPD